MRCAPFLGCTKWIGCFVITGLFSLISLVQVSCLGLSYSGWKFASRPNDDLLPNRRRGRFIGRKEWSAREPQDIFVLCGTKEKKKGYRNFACWPCWNNFGKKEGPAFRGTFPNELLLIKMNFNREFQTCPKKRFGPKNLARNIVWRNVNEWNKMPCCIKKQLELLTDASFFCFQVRIFSFKHGVCESAGNFVSKSWSLLFPQETKF